MSDPSSPDDATLGAAFDDATIEDASFAGAGTRETRNEAGATAGFEAQADIADGVLRPVDRRYITAQRIEGAIVAGVVAGGLLVVGLLSWFLEWLPEWGSLTALTAWPLVTLLVAFLALRYPLWEYERYRYRVGPDGIEIRRGVVWRSVSSVPRSRVQHTDVTRGPVQRRLGLATLTIHTAGTQDASVELAGLAEAVAYRIRDHLIEGGARDAV